MDHFHFKENSLYCEDVKLEDVARKFGTPIYVYSKATLIRHLQVFQRSINKLNGLVCFSVKALSNINILRILNDHKCGFDIVSGGEMYRCLKAGVKPNKIIFSGVGKTKEEIGVALRQNILSFNIESESEIERIANLASAMKLQANISIRVNPDIDQGGHEYVKTGRAGDKFGISFNEAKMIINRYKNHNCINFVGIACHIGSQILDLDGFEKAAIKMRALADDVSVLGINLKMIDMGGGLGVRYKDEATRSPKELMEIYERIFKNRKEKIIVEPGRAIAANAGIFIAKVEYIKDKFIISDGAMNDLLRPSLYKADHEVWPIQKTKETDQKFDLVGPICETGDYLARNISISVRKDSLLAVRSAGAYGFVMSSNYNSRTRAAEILVDGDKYLLIRKRETLEDLISHEMINDD